MTTRDPGAGGGAPDMPERDPATLAAEFSLGLLEGEELMAARGRLLSDPEFAWRKNWWDDWFVPLSDDIAGAETGEHVWQQISTRLAEAAAGEAAGDTASAPNVAALAEARAARESARRWRWTAALTSAAAALAIAVLIIGPGTAPVSESGTGEQFAANTPAPLMASMPVGETLRLGITYLPDQREMLVSASGLSSDGVHDHELWLVPGDGGALQSLGVVAPGQERRFPVSDDITRNMADGAQLLLTREPLGGKPEGVDAGPVVAEAQLAAV